MSASREFWDRVGPEIGWVHKQLRRLGVQESDLDDVTQEVLVAVHRRWTDYDQARSIRSWLFGFSFRMASDHRRRVVRTQRNTTLDETLIHPGPSAEEDALLAESRDLLISCLDALDDDKRAILVLVDLEEHTVPEAAHTLMIPVNTGYSRLRTARAELAEAVRARSARGST